MNGICRQLASAAVKALVLEVSTSPKPGLVDRFSCGAHKDMDFYTFIDSAFCLEPYFAEMAGLGLKNAAEEGALKQDAPEKAELEKLRAVTGSSVYGQGEPKVCKNAASGGCGAGLAASGASAPSLTLTMLALKEIGIRAEKAMLEVTGGANTHRGALFILGIMCCAMAEIWAEEGRPDIEKACLMASASGITRNLCRLELEGLRNAGFQADNSGLSHGEKIYLRYGVTGARGQAESGFSDVREKYLPKLRGFLAGGMERNEAYLRILLLICSETDCTNVLSRGGLEAADFVKRRCMDVYRSFSQAAVEKLGCEFTERGISPGGCADLLGLTLFLNMF